MITKKTLYTVAAIALVLVTTPIYFTIGGLSLMAFDSPDALGWSFAVVGTVIGVSLLVLIGSLIGSIKMIRKEKFFPGIGISLLPALVLGVFWLWVAQQSFS